MSRDLGSLGRATGLMCVPILLIILSCASSSPRKSEFEREFERYLSLPHQKVMAIAGDPKGRWVYGYGYAAPPRASQKTPPLSSATFESEALGLTPNASSTPSAMRSFGSPTPPKFLSSVRLPAAQHAAADTQQRFSIDS
jgi:hypothetical protein